MNVYTLELNPSPVSSARIVYTTAYKSNLKALELTHSAVKPFACKQCSYTIFREDNLKRHNGPIRDR